MKKIIAGFLGLVMLVTVVGGTAFALFSATAKVSGVTFATGNADLKISTDGSNYYNPYNFGGSFFSKLYPAINTVGPQFLIKNTSNSNIALILSVQLKNGDVTENPAGSWAVLKDVVQVGFDYYDGSWHTAGLATLAQWNSPGYSLEGGNLAQGNQRWYRIHVVVPSTADNTIADKGLYSTIFTFTGTQAP